jgi:hypothetical protein
MMVKKLLRLKHNSLKYNGKQQYKTAAFCCIIAYIKEAVLIEGKRY